MIIHMIKYLQKIIDGIPGIFTSTKVSPAMDNLFKVRGDEARNFSLKNRQDIFTALWHSSYSVHKDNIRCTATGLFLDYQG